MDLPPIGLYEPTLRFGTAEQVASLAREAEGAGFSMVWLPDVGGGVLSALDLVLCATSALAVGTGVLNMWMHEASAIAAGWSELERRHERRPVLGLGVSHKALVDAFAPGRFATPIRATEQYLDALDASMPPLPADNRLLAALGPRMLALAAERCAGAFPYHMPPEHTLRAREALGPSKVLVVEQAVVLDDNRTTARERIATQMSHYLTMPNYLNAWRSLGFDENDFAGAGSDRLLDAIYVIGSTDNVARRVQEHRDAGADHICLQVLTADDSSRVDAWRRLADVLL